MQLQPYRGIIILLLSLMLLEIVHGGVTRNARSQPEDTKNRSNSYNHTQSKAIKRGFGLSAWSIIAVLLTLILSGMFIYYFLLFYPIMCRKQRKYDVVEHSRDTTPTPTANDPEKIP